MKQGDRDLLLKDLCARLPYGVIIEHEGNLSKLDTIFMCDSISISSTSIDKNLFYNLDLDEFKPYLFPLSSMTEEQKKEYYSLADDVTIKPGQGCYLGIKIHCIKLGISDNPHEEVWDYINLDALDWLNKNHFDYRGLIEKELAIDCTNLNIY